MSTDLYVAGFGYLSAAERIVEPVPFALKPKMIPGGQAAKELVMLPEDMEPAAPLTGVVQPKPNGIRALFLGDTIVTREGVPMNCALKALCGLQRLSAAFGRPMVFDGEWVEPGDFNATLSAFQRGHGEGVFWIFDALPIEEWVWDKGSAPIETRLLALRQLIDAARSPHVGLLLDQFAAEPAAVEAMATMAWRSGGEGIVVKKSGSLYRRRRSPDWRRWKETITVDCTVMDTLHKNGRLRKIMVRGPTGPLTIGSGWTEADEKRLEIDTEALIEVAYNPMPGTGKPRHARFVRFLDDKRRIK